MKPIVKTSLLTLLTLLIITGIAWASIPPHPRVLEKIRSGEIAKPYYLRNMAELRAKGINAPWSAPALKAMPGDQLDGAQRRFGPAAVPTGNYNALVILVDFSDKIQQVQATFFDTLIFGAGAGSMQDYFSVLSYGNLDVVTVNLPSAIGWARAPQTYAYYVDAQNGFGEYPQNSQGLVEAVVNLVNTSVDFSQYDNNGDGYVDALFVVHSGTGAEWTVNDNDMWSHAWAIPSPVLLDNVYIWRYSVEPEYWDINLDGVFDAGEDMTIGVYAHEMAHAAFGLPDLYDRDGTSGGLGRWTLLAGGSWNGTLGSSPALPDAWTHIQMGYITPIVHSANSAGYVIAPVADSAEVHLLWTDGGAGNEYFLVENRQLLSFDAALPGGGLLIYHVDETVGTQNDNEWYPGYTASGHYLVALEQADGLWDLETYANSGDGGDPFPGSTANATFNAGSLPNSDSYAGSGTMVAVTNINDGGYFVTADLAVTVGAPPVIVVTPDSLSEDLFAGETSVQYLTISNTGAGDLYWSVATQDQATPPVLSDPVPYPADYYYDVPKGAPDYRLGHPVERGQGGPDIFGYTWIDSDEPGGPIFDWVDISGTGVFVPGLTDDSYVGPFPLGFTFNYYGTDYTEFYIGSNGYLGFGPTDGYSDLSNDPIPSTSTPNNILAWCWDDLYPYGSVYYQSDGNELIVQFVDYGEFGGSGLVNAEVIIHSNGAITYQYLNFLNGFDVLGSTVGIENSYGTDGVEVAFNAPYLHDNLAVHFSTGPDWLSVAPSSGTVGPGGFVDLDVTFNASGQIGGDYYANIIISSNDTINPEVTVPVHLQVIGIPAIAVSTDMLDYDRVFVSTLASESLTVSNQGTDSLTVSAISSDNTAFTPDITTFVLYEGESREVTVTFAPTAVGAYIGTLTITSDDPDEPSVTAALFGEGVAPPVVDVSPDSLSEDLFTGELSVLYLTINNTGGSELAFDISSKKIDTAAVSMVGSSSDLISGGRTFTQDSRNIGFYADETRKRVSPVQLPRQLTGQAQGPALSPGDTLGVYGNFPYANTGMVWVGDTLYVVGYEDEYLHRYDVTTQQVVGSFPIHTYPYGIAWDGQYLWIGDAWGNIYGYDLSGNNVGSFSAPFYDFPALTWDGQYFLIAQAFSINSTIYRVDHTASIIETFTTSHGGESEAIVWVPGHNSLWLYDSYYGRMLQLALADGVASVVSEFAFYDDYYAYSLGHDGTDLWWSDWDGPLYQIDDGLQEGVAWLSFTPASGTVPAGSSLNIAVTFDATGQAGGEYDAGIFISSNDPVTPEVRVPAHLSVSSAPDIAVSQDTLDYGSVFVGYPDTLSLLVVNRGTNSLVVSSIAADDAAFAVDMTAFVLYPGESQAVAVIFSPAAAGTFAGTLTIISDDPDESSVTVALFGEGVELPVIAVSPDSLGADLFTGGSSVQQLTIDNSGAADLVWEIDLENIDLGSVTFTKVDYADWTLSDNQDRITDNVWITRANTQGIFNAATESYYSWDSPHDTEWAYGLTENLSPGDYQVWRDAIGAYPPGMVGQSISLHLISDDMYFDVMFHSWTAGGNGGGFSYTRTDVDPHWLDLSQTSGVLSADSTQVITVTIDATGLSGGDYDARIAVISNDPANPEVSVPAHLHVTGAPDIAVSADSLDLGTAFLGWPVTSTLVIANVGTNSLIVSGIASDNAAYTVDVTAFGLYPGESQLVVVTFAPASTGTIAGTLTIASNDPDAPSVTVALLGQGVNPPAIAVSPDSLSANLYTGDVVVQTMTITNSGLGELDFDISIRRVEGAPVLVQVKPSKQSIAKPATLLNQRASLKPKYTNRAAKNRVSDVTMSSMEESREALLSSGFVAGPPVDPSIRILTVDFADYGWGILDVQGLSYTIVSADEFAIVDFSDYDVLYIPSFPYSPPLYERQEDISAFVQGGGGLVATTADDWGWIPASVTGESWDADQVHIIEPEHPVMDSLTEVGLSNWGQSYHNIFSSYDPSLSVLAEALDSPYSVSALVLAGKVGVGRLVITGLHNEHYEEEGIRMVGNMIGWAGGSSWLFIDHASGTVPAGSSLNIAVTFDATGLDGGDYDVNIMIAGNDPATPEVLVPAHLQVTGAPNIAVSADTLDYGVVFLGWPATNMLIVSNNGSDSLTVSDIVSTEAAFTVDMTAFVLYPGESQAVAVTFAPTAVGVYSSALTITSDDPDESSVMVRLLGEGLNPPVIAVSPDSLSEVLSPGDSSTQILTIDNSAGASALVYEIFVSTTEHGNAGEQASVGPAAAESGSGYHSSMISWRELLRSITEDRQRQAGDPHLTTYGSLVSSGEPAWRLLHIDPDEPDIGYDIKRVYGAVTQDEILFKLESYTPLPDSGFFAAVLIDADRDPATGWNVAADNEIDWQVDLGVDYLILVEPEFDVYALLRYVHYFEGDEDNWEWVGNLTTYSVEADSTELILGINSVHFDGFSAINLAVVAGDYDEPDLVPDPGQGHITFYLMPSWLRLSTVEGVIPAGNQADITVTFDAAAIQPGHHRANIVIASNDPQNSLVSIAAKLQVLAPPVDPPQIVAIDDVPGDQGGWITSSWNASPNDGFHVPDPVQFYSVWLKNTGPAALPENNVSEKVEPLTGIILIRKQRAATAPKKNNTFEKKEFFKRAIKGLEGTGSPQSSGEQTPGISSNQQQDAMNAFVLGKESPNTQSEFALPPELKAAMSEGGEWIGVGTIGATQDSLYSFLVPTLQDSNQTGINWSFVKISAHTSDPYNYAFSAVDSGYSVDNIVPGVPASLTAAPVEAGIMLSWSYDFEAVEDFQYFAIYRGSDEAFLPQDLDSASFVTADTSLVDFTVVVGETYYYLVAAIDYNRNYSELAGPVMATLLGLDELLGVPEVFALRQNYPNPFNPSTTIQFDVPEATDLSLIVYDILGREVIRLRDGFVQPGYIDVVWDGRTTAGATVAAGIYFTRVVTPDYSRTIKMLLLK